LFVSRGGIPLGEIGGHEIRLDVFAFGFFGLFIYLTSGDPQWTVAFLLAAFAAILLHDPGHALAIGVLTKEDTVIVIGFGGATFHNYIRALGKQVLVSLAGPAAGFLGGLAAWGIARVFIPGQAFFPSGREFFGLHETWELTLNFFLWASFGWTVLNLVPAIPLDGGHALRGLLLVFGVPNRPARRWTRRLAVAIAIVLGGYAVIVMREFILGLIAVMVIMAAYDEARSEGW